MSDAIHITAAPDDFDDWEDLHTLLHVAFASMDGRIDPPSSLHGMDAAALRDKAGEEALFLAHDNANLIGCLFAAVGNDRLYIGKIAIDPFHQAKGIARRLMMQAEDLARAKGLTHLELQTRIELTENHQAFAALGFEKTSETAHPGYGRMTSITMRKSVPPRGA